MKKIVFFIRSLNAGGAEHQLVITATGLAELGYDVTVLTFYSDGFYANELANTKVQLLSLDKKGRWDLLAFLFRLFKVLRRHSPDVIYSYMNTANILAVLLRPFIFPVRIVWSVRASNVDLDEYDWLSRWSYWLECRLSRFADVIISNSHAGLEYAVEHDFPRQKITVIPNGIDTERFYPDKSAGHSLRQCWGVAENERLIGVVGRIDPMKGIPIFLEAAAKIKLQYAHVRFVWVGVGESGFEKEMHELATQLNLDDVLIWAGRHTDMLAVYNAFDIASSSSYGEGFPNVLGEAMACGVPCVVTDVGDSALVVGETGKVVPAKDSNALSSAWDEMLLLDDEEIKPLSVSARKRVVNEFSVKALLNDTEHVISQGTS
ncbi:glycosyltransferase [Methylophilaceae bacterium]|nr:glycosyltransferase [Methylophilaceae bacterium]